MLNFNMDKHDSFGQVKNTIQELGEKAIRYKNIEEVSVANIIKIRSDFEKNLRNDECVVLVLCKDGYSALQLNSELADSMELSTKYEAITEGVIGKYNDIVVLTDAFTMKPQLTTNTMMLVVKSKETI